MSYVVEVDGVRVEAESEAAARKELRRLAKQQRAVSSARQERYARAKSRAMERGYRLLAQRAGGEPMPRGWVLYRPEQDWSRYLYTPAADSTYGPEGHRDHVVHCEEGRAVLSHYGCRLVGGVCNGAGFLWLVFLDDGQRVDCYAVAVDGDTVALADCPGVTMDHFHTTAE
jgi:hypothetical protein